MMVPIQHIDELLFDFYWSEHRICHRFF